MRYRRWLIQALVLPLVAILGQPAQAAEPGQTQWKLSQFTWVKRVPAEPGAPGNGHPAQVSGAAILKALGSVLVKVDGRDTPLFEPNELPPLVKALREAFASAQPSEDLVLLSTQRRGGHFLDPSLAVTARLFLEEGVLNVIVHDARLDFMDRYSADRTLPTFVYGSRTATASISLKAEAAIQRRSDWLVLPIPETPVVQAPVPLEAQPAPGPQPAEPKHVEPIRDAAFYEAQSQRLKALKRLRDENLISEVEYQQKRGEILKVL